MWAIILLSLLKFFISPSHSGLWILQQNGREAQDAVRTIKRHASKHFQIYETGRADFRICAVNAMVRRLSSFTSQRLEQLERGWRGTLSLNMQCLTYWGQLYWYHTGVQNLKILSLDTTNGEKPTAYCLRGCYLCFSLICSGRLIHRKGLAMTPTFHEVPNLPRDRESYWVSIRKQESWGSELTYVWQASKGEELELCAWGCTDPDICSSGELIKLLRVVMVHCQVSSIYISHPLQGEQ